MHCEHRRKARREVRSILERLELPLRVRVVVGDVGPAMRFDHVQVHEERRHRPIVLSHFKYCRTHTWFASRGVASARQLSFRPYLREYEGDLNIDDRLVADLVAACRSVAEKLESLPPISSPWNRRA